MKETSDAEVLVGSELGLIQITHLNVPWQCWRICAGWYTICGNLRSGHTRLLPKKSQLWSYCDASCSNVGQFSYYNRITEKCCALITYAKCVRCMGADTPSPPPPAPVLMPMLGRNHSSTRDSTTMQRRTIFLPHLYQVSIWVA